MTQVSNAFGKKTILLLLAALAMLLVASDSSALAAGRTARCADVTASGGAFVAQQVRATGISCNSLRGKLRGWTRKGAASLPKGAGGWRCGRLAGRSSTYKCTRRGHASRATFAIARDRVAPAIALASPVDGAQYDAGASVTVAYACSDNAKIATCVGTAPNGSALPTSAAGGQSFTVIATDKAGNRTTRTVSYTVSREKDITAPTIDLQSPAEGARYERESTVRADYSCADSVAVASCEGTVSDGSAIATDTLGRHTFSVTAKDSSGNVTTKQVTYTVTDTKAPTISLSSPVEDAKYAFGSTVLADYSCADDVAVASCEGTVSDGSAIATDTLGRRSFSVTAKDSSGNVTTKQVSYTVTDTKAPTVTVTSPVTGASFTWNQSVTVAYSCADEVALATCVGTVSGKGVANGSKLPTSGAPGPGTRTLRVEASDNSGNVTTKDVEYTVKPAGYYALTFDDGPNALYTQPVLNTLASVNAKATFFLVGSQIQSFPGLAEALLAGGHSLQNHTMTHANLGPPDPTDPTVPPTTADPAGEMTNANAAIQAVGSPAPTFLRPPYGMYDANTVTLARSLGLEIANWTTDTNDYTAGMSPATIAANAKAVPDKGIILMHDSTANTVTAIPLIVNGLRDERGMLPGKLAKSTTQHFITGWEDAGGGLGFYVEAVAP